jgi:hypothetical protein
MSRQVGDSIVWAGLVIVAILWWAISGGMAFVFGWIYFGYFGIYLSERDKASGFFIAVFLGWLWPILIGMAVLSKLLGISRD